MKALTAALAVRLLLLGGHSYAPAPAELLSPAVPETGITETVPERFSILLNSAGYSSDVQYQVTFALPEGWEWGGNSTTGDLAARLAGRYAVKRSEVFPVFSAEVFEGYYADAQKSEGILSGGLEYVRFTQKIAAEAWELTGTPDRLADIYYYNIKIPGTEVYAVLVLLVYEDDPADYFETHIQPLLDSITIE